MNLNNVNKPNTREWGLFNENSRGASNREKLIQKHGGSFTKIGKNWVWNYKIKKNIVFPNSAKKRNIFIFTDKQGIKYITDNFESFCRDRDINTSAMHEVVNGKRKTFKGFTAERIRASDIPDES